MVAPSCRISRVDVNNLMSWLKSNPEACEFGTKFSVEDVAYDRMTKTFVDGHFELPLPWKDVLVMLSKSLELHFCSCIVSYWRCLMINGPKKSVPVWKKGASNICSLTGGRFAMTWVVGLASLFLQNIRCWITLAPEALG